jgi:hypothetical protein
MSLCKCEHGCAQMQYVLLKYYLVENLFFFHWRHKRSKKRLWHHKSQSVPQIFKTVVVLSVIPNPSPVLHEGCRPGGRPHLCLITPSASTDSTSAIHNVQLAIRDTNLPYINISHLKNCNLYNLSELIMFLMIYIQVSQSCEKAP